MHINKTPALFWGPELFDSWASLLGFLTAMVQAAWLCSSLGTAATLQRQVSAVCCPQSHHALSLPPCTPITCIGLLAVPQAHTFFLSPQHFSVVQNMPPSPCMDSLGICPSGAIWSDLPETPSKTVIGHHLAPWPDLFIIKSLWWLCTHGSHASPQEHNRLHQKIQHSEAEMSCRFPVPPVSVLGSIYPLQCLSSKLIWPSAMSAQAGSWQEGMYGTVFLSWPSCNLSCPTSSPMAPF